jgi:hypothetical protein
MSSTLKANSTVENTHDSLKRAVHKALERKRKLGQYTVQWRENKILIHGQDAPAPIAIVAPDPSID